MKIIFSPGYSGAVFVNSDNYNGVLMDTTVVNTIGLVHLLELRLGIHHEELSVKERTALYYDALKKFIKENPSSILTPSFKLAGLSTAKAILAWRDELRYANWDFEGKGISSRIDTIIGVEKYFREKIYEYSENIKYCDLTDRIHDIINILKQGDNYCCDLTLSLPCDKVLMHPIEKTLLATMEECGAKITLQPVADKGSNNINTVRRLIQEDKNKTIRLAPKDNDRSLRIWKFHDDIAANEYLAYKAMEDVNVWINADNKQMDNWLYMMDKPLTGSHMVNSCPLLTQMLVIGISLFSNPLNVNNLLEWLNMPIHPLNSFFRAQLADTIAKQGGFRNEECMNVIMDYIEGRFVFLDDEQKELPEEEKEKLRKKNKKKRAKYANLFLPGMESNEAFVTESLRNFVSELSAWSNQKAFLMLEENSNQLWAEQLRRVSLMADAFRLLLDSIDTQTISQKTIDSWLSTLYSKDTFTNTLPEQGCRIVIDSPDKIISISGKTVWIGVEGDYGHSLECSFLYPSEREALVRGKHISIWNEKDERMYHQTMQMQALMKTSGELILVVCEHRGGELTQKHPLLVRLEQQIENIDAIIEYPQIGIESTVPVNKITRPTTDMELTFNHADLVRWPQHLSPTVIDTLIKHPFDFLMEQLLHIEADSRATMSSIKTTMGNVAHAVIERLFAPQEGKKYASADDVKQRLNSEFEDTYARIIEANGAILQLPENQLDEKLLHEQMKRCLYALLDIISCNDLKVVACERFVEDNMKLGLIGKSNDDENTNINDVIGYIDMILEDSAGDVVVFDFKWTSSRKYYQDLLASNRSIQLELYRRMLSKSKHADVKRVAYFLMPQARLYSKDDFKGQYCVRINPENEDNIVEKVRNSILYRKEQLSNGVVETNGDFDSLQYVIDTESHNLFSLEKNEDSGCKKDNIFSNYGLFLNFES